MSKEKREREREIESKDLKEFCKFIKIKLSNQNRPFILAVGKIPAMKDSTQGVLVSGAISQIEGLLIEVLTVVTEKKENL